MLTLVAAIHEFCVEMSLAWHCGICQHPDMDIRQIIDAAGGPVKLAHAVGRDHSTILKWTRVPAHHLRAVSDVTGIAPADLRPDLDVLRPKVECA